MSNTWSGEGPLEIDGENKTAPSIVTMSRNSSMIGLPPSRFPKSLACINVFLQICSKAVNFYCDRDLGWMSPTSSGVMIFESGFNFATQFLRKNYWPACNDITFPYDPVSIEEEGGTLGTFPSTKFKKKLL